jgi:methylthioribose-1-phosphate isomerase
MPSELEGDHVCKEIKVINTRRAHENMSEPECHDNENQLREKKADEDKPFCHGSDSTIGKPYGIPHMSAIHEIAFIITICMAQILALSGLGQALRISSMKPT